MLLSKLYEVGRFALSAKCRGTSAFFSSECKYPHDIAAILWLDERLRAVLDRPNPSYIALQPAICRLKMLTNL